MACVVLHNRLRTERGAGAARDLEDEVIPCKPANSAKEQRDYLRDWFNGAGAVPWLDGKV